MNKKNTFRDRMGMGLPDDKKETSTKKSLFSAGITNPTTGLKSSTTYTKNQAKHQADTVKKISQNDKKEQEKQGPALNTGLMFSRPKITTRGVLKESIASFEHNIVLFSNRLNSKIDNLIQEATAGSAPKPQRNVNIEKIGHNVQEKRMIDDMTKVIEMKQQQQIKQSNQASEIQPGTEMTAKENTIGLTQPATDMNAQARMQAAQNHAQVVEKKYSEEE